MKIAVLIFAALPLLAGDLETFTDNSLNPTQRNTACFAMRGDKSEEAIAAMRAALRDPGRQACAGRNLREAGAWKELLDALEDKEPSARATAARELGASQKPEFVAALRKTAADRDLLVATNALEGLVRYENRSSAPEIRDIAMSGGVLTSLAVDALIDWRDPEVASTGRKLMARGDPGDQLIGIRAVGRAGDESDLARLRELARDETAMSAGNRGFGFMPAVSLSRAARTAIENIERRAAAR